MGVEPGGIGQRLLMAARLATRLAIDLLDKSRASRLGRLPIVSELLIGVTNHVIPPLTRVLYREGPQPVNGILMAVPRPPAWGGGGEFHMVVGSYERRELQFLLHHLQPGDCFVDVGAHIGYFTLPSAKQVGPTGRVIAIEPTTESARLLRENVELNGFAWVDVVEAAASNSSGRAQFTTSDASWMWNTLEVGTLREPATLRMVETRTIDDVLAQVDWPRVTWIKIDVEGHEQAVLDGCHVTVERYPDVRFMFEVSGGPAERIDASVRTLQAFQASGFEFFEIVSTHQAVPIDAEEITSRLHIRRWQNLLFNLVAKRPAERSLQCAPSSQPTEEYEMTLTLPQEYQGE